MQIFRLFFSFFLLLVFTSCEKEITSEKGEKGLSTELTDDIKRQAITVEQAIDIDQGYTVIVKGYIVAAAESSIKNADFRKPFAGKTAILISDEKSEASNDQYFYNLMPISLSGTLKDRFNLQENPDMWNAFVYIQGLRTNYMNTAGIKEVKNIWLDANHNPNDDNIEPNPNPNPDDDDDSTIDDGGNNGDWLTVAQAIAAPTEQVIKVVGYVVATTSKSMNNIKFEDIHENYTALVLADDVNTTEREKLFPVGVSKEIRDELAAYDAGLKNLRVVVLGNKDTYLGQPGIKKAVSVVIVPTANQQ